MGEEEALPDHLRCNRTDGRQWRCRRRVKDNMKLCEIHYLQGLHRQYKEKVPESLKLQRTSKKKTLGKDKDDLITRNVEIRAWKVKRFLMRKRGSSEAAEALTGRKKKLKREDTRLELIRMVLKREVEKRKKKKEEEGRDTRKKVKMKKKKDGENEEEEEEELVEEELRRELPNGLMAISPALAPPGSGNVGTLCDAKLGADLNKMLSRRFRSKNIERVPIGKLQVVSSGQIVGRLKSRRKKCHWCQKSGLWNLIKCSNCQKQFFCMDCIKERYFDTQNEVKIACPVCQGTCTCKDCLPHQSKESESKEIPTGKCRVDRILKFHYLICALLPVLKQIKEDQKVELDNEAKMRGKKPSGVLVNQSEIKYNEQHFCNNCQSPIMNLHRSCPTCSYSLCLSCSWDFCWGGNARDVKSITSKPHQRRKVYVSIENNSLEKKIRSNSKQHFCEAYLAKALTHWRSCNGFDDISCPPTELGGCGESFLGLRSIFTLNWINTMEVSAEEIVCSYDFPESLDKTSCCSLCLATVNRNDGFDQLREAAVREDSNDNYLFYPLLSDIQGDNFEHFQKHWGKGHPVIVRSVLQSTSNLSWDPLYMFCTYLERCIKKYENNKDLLQACLDWCEVEINVRQYFAGSLRGQTQRNVWHEMLKLNGWLTSQLFREEFPSHFADLMHALPIQDYMNPISGALNLAANLPKGISKPELGPCVHISYGCADDLVRVESVTKLCYGSYDLINILVHTTDDPISAGQFTKIRKLLKKHRTCCQRESSEITTEQIKENKINGKLLLQCEVMKERGLHNMIKGKRNCCQRLPGISCVSGDATDACSQILIDSAVSHNRECDSNSEPSLLLRGAAPSTKTAVLKSYGDHVQSSRHGRETVFTNCSGAQWDVFRRQDVPKLIEYLRKHCDDFSLSNGYEQQMVHPILDQRFFLDTTHKIRLKEEFNIEPWTFEQHLGEAVIIPAGCPYQIQTSKCSVHVVLDFVSPENVIESSQLIDEIRLLPADHKAKVAKLEVYGTCACACACACVCVYRGDH